VTLHKTRAVLLFAHSVAGYWHNYAYSRHKIKHIWRDYVYSRHKVVLGLAQFYRHEVDSAYDSS